MNLIYTQANGYASYSGKSTLDFPELAAIDDCAKLLRAQGYEHQWEYKQGDEFQGDHIEGFMMKGSNRYGFPTYLVTYWNYDEGHHIYCDDPGDFFALRMEACRNRQVVSPLMFEILEAVKKTFRATHGHDHLEICHKCDPEEIKREREAAQQRRERAQSLKS